MKKPVQVVEVDGEGLEKFLGEKVFLMCCNYFYTGVLGGVNKQCVLLNNANIVYDTGSWTADSYKDAQSLGPVWYVSIDSIESFGPGK